MTTPVFYFTFGSGQPHANRYVKIDWCADYLEARTAMVERFGFTWAFQYDADEFTGQPEQYGITELVLCERCDDRGRVSEATEDYHGEPICPGCHDSIGERQDERAAEERY